MQQRIGNPQAAPPCPYADIRLGGAVEIRAPGGQKPQFFGNDLKAAALALIMGGMIDLQPS